MKDLTGSKLLPFSQRELELIASMFQLFGYSAAFSPPVRVEMAALTEKLQKIVNNS